MKHETYAIKLHDKEYFKAMPFINECLIQSIPLECIDTNDFHCNYAPAVYIHNKENYFIMKKYFRMSIKDVKRAVAFYNSKTPYKATNLAIAG